MGDIGDVGDTEDLEHLRQARPTNPNPNRAITRFGRAGDIERLQRYTGVKNVSHPAV